MMLKSVLAAAACVAAAVAQGNLAFVGFPAAVQAVGTPVELKWEGGNGSPVTITLRQGDPNNLKDVAVLTSSATGNSYTWTPSASLASGSDYALQISQSGGSPNYYGPFTLSGGSSATNSASITSSASSALSSASSALSSASSLLASISSNSSASSNSTTLSTSNKPTLSSTATSTRSATSSGSSSTASSTGGATGSSGAAGLSSPIALVFGAVAAMLYLN